jgi:ABC-2 type transport system ATP-binding protein
VDCRSARRDFWDEIHGLAANGITVLVSTHYMDEAERCHRLAYLAYGRLLASGTAEEVIAAQRLTGFAVTGPDLAGIAAQLREEPGVEQVTMFGNTLHVVGHDAQALAATAARFDASAGQHWEALRPGLEDVFIGLMHGVEDNFQ